MPEGPELSHSRDQLRGLVVGKRLESIGIVGGRYVNNAPVGMHELLEVMQERPVTVASVDVKGKFMHWRLEPKDGSPWYMWCTYGMSGQWTLAKPDKHTAVTVWVDPPRLAIHFRDPRRFGTLKFVNDELEHLKKLSSLGPDMLNSPPSLQVFMDRLISRGLGRSIAETLMDQRIVSGVGNYIKAEALYRAHVAPQRMIGTLTPTEICDLYQAINDVMHMAYESRGASLKTYRDPEGNKGGAQFQLQVYGKRTDPMGNAVLAEETADGRTSWWCPAVQK